MFQGSMVALVTPFKNDQVDFDKLGELVDSHLAAGTHGIVPCGTTGESPTLSHKEHREVIEAVVDRAAGRVPVIAGTGSNSTAEALELTGHAKKVGADGALIVVPYYNKPTQNGLYEHFKTVAREVDIPIVMYNIPGRTGVNMEPPTIARLAEIDNIVAVKECTGNMDQASRMATTCDLTILSGDDSLTLPLMALGAKGVISVVANLVPEDVKNLCEAALAGDFATARKVHLKLFPLCRAVFLETNPIPVKTAMRMLGRLNGEMRLPLVPMQPENEQALERALRDYGLL